MMLKYSNTQLAWLVVLRMLIGWHFLYEGISKLVNPDWSSAPYLLDSGGLFRSLFFALTNNSHVLQVVDFLNQWGLVAIGLGLILGVLTRIATISGIVLLAFYFLSHPPLVGVSYAVPSEGSYLLVNKTLIELAALIVLLVFPSGHLTGLDRFICGRKD